jgi:hypothetical protein
MLGSAGKDSLLLATRTMAETKTSFWTGTTPIIDTTLVAFVHFSPAGGD